MNHIHAVIFDLDGTLIDTEKYYRICWPKAVEHFGYTMTDEQALTRRSSSGNGMERISIMRRSELTASS